MDLIAHVMIGGKSFEIHTGQFTTEQQAADFFLTFTSVHITRLTDLSYNTL